jgi:hypothetical protein
MSGLADCVVQRVGLIVELYPHGLWKRANDRYFVTPRPCKNDPGCGVLVRKTITQNGRLTSQRINRLHSNGFYPSVANFH